MMGTDSCDVNHLDSDALLPPRKRLLAGMKRHNSDVNSPIPSASSSSIGSDFHIRLNNLMRSHLSNPNLSNVEIAEASRLAAIDAVKVAEAARTVAEEKAAKAAKAVAAAKRALELVASVSEEAARKEKYLKKNKMKKQVPVQTLYDKQKGDISCKTDEELARKLHQVINSSPRISKNPSSSDLKDRKHKRPKYAMNSSKTAIQNGRMNGEENQPSATNGNGMVREVNSEGLIHEETSVTVDLNSSKGDEFGQLKIENGEGSSVVNKIDGVESENRGESTFQSGEKVADALDDSCGPTKKKGRIKQKKLPLSICNFRDQSSPKDERKSKFSLPTEENSIKISTGDNKALTTVGSSSDNVMPVERTLWKCQVFKAPSVVKQNKVVQS